MICVIFNIFHRFKFGFKLNIENKGIKINQLNYILFIFCEIFKFKVKFNILQVK